MEIPTLFFSLLLNGLVFSAMLVLFSLGLNLIFSYLNVLNMAHGGFYTLGIYLSMTLATTIALKGLLPTYSILLLVIVAGGVVGLIAFVIEPLLLRRVYARGHADQLLLTYGLLLVLDDLVKLGWGLELHSVPEAYYFLGSLPLFGVSFPNYNFFLLFTCFLLAWLLWFILYKTTFGKTCRAIAEHRDMVRALGVNSEKLFTLIFVIGVVFAGWGGSLMMPLSGIFPGIGLEPLILSFIIVAIGGLGSLKGAVIGSFIVGLIRSIGIGYFPEIELMIVYLIMAIILLIRPQGLFGRREIVW